MSDLERVELASVIESFDHELAVAFRDGQDWYELPAIVRAVAMDLLEHCRPAGVSVSVEDALELENAS